MIFVTAVAPNNNSVADVDCKKKLAAELHSVHEQ